MIFLGDFYARFDLNSPRTRDLLLHKRCTDSSVIPVNTSHTCKCTGVDTTYMLAGPGEGAHLNANFLQFIFARFACGSIKTN